MMNATHVARELRSVFPHEPPRTIAEIGAGDGHFMLKVAGKLSRSRGGAEVVLVDRQSLLTPATNGQFTALGWRAHAVQADVFAWLAQPAAPVFDVIVANLFLHHFDAAELSALLALIARRTRVLIACEPRRSGRALVASQLLGLIGCNDVSRHDAVVSVRAGFDGREVSALWPAGGAWKLQEHARGLFSHCFAAARTDANASIGQARNA
jgi:hypothetical protein